MPFHINSSILLFVLFFCIACHGWIILNDTSFTCPKVVWPRSQQLPNIIEGRVVYENSSSIAGNIVVTGRGHPAGARDLQNQGAIGVIFTEFGLVPGLAMFGVSGDERDIFVPICQTFQSNIDKFIGHVVLMDPTEPNEWEIMNNSPVAISFQVLVSAFCLTNIILAIHRSVLFYRAFGPIIGFAQVCLACEIIANTIRFVYAAVDPAFMRQIYPFSVGYILLSVSFPFTFAALCLMTFYWHELISKTSLKINRFLGRSRIGFYIVIAILFAVEIVTGPFRTVDYDLNKVILVMGVMYGVIAVAVAGFYWITGARVIAFLAHRSQANSDVALNMLKRTTTRIVISGVLLICYIGSMAFISFPDFKRPIGIMLIWFLAYMFLSGTSLMQILSFYPRVKYTTPLSSTNMQRSPSSSSNNNHKQNSITTYNVSHHTNTPNSVIEAEEGQRAAIESIKPSASSESSGSE